MLKVRKAYAIQKGTVAAEGNSLIGMASPIGRPDRGGDIPFPGLFQSVLGGFLTNGFIPVGHEWEDLPVAYPTEAYEGQGEKGYGLYSTCVFHSTQAGQDARTVCKERLEAGLSVGLSVGMILDRDGYLWFESGARALEYAAANKYDMSLFDQKAVAQWDQPCRGLFKCRELFEYSIVTVPMAEAYGLTMKGADGGPLSGLTLKEHLSAMLTTVEDGVNRVIQARNQRISDGRDLSPDRKAETMAVLNGLRTLEAELKSTIVQMTVWVDAEQDGDPGEGAAAKAETLDLVHRSLVHKVKSLMG